MQTDPANLQPTHGERRQNPHLREIFEGAALRLHHHFHGHDDWAGTSHDFLALRIVHEAYPELETAEVRTLVAAIGQRMQTDGLTHILTA